MGAPDAGVGSARGAAPASAPPPAWLAWIGGPLLIAAACAAMAAWTWGAWPDVLVDFGRELYVPWRLSEGAVLYRDIAWFNGPLSAYANALLFELFGASLLTLVVANLALLALLTGLVWAIVRSISDALAATAAALVLVLIFGFGQLVGIGNYNFVCPYSHEVTHGLVLGLAALACLLRWERRRRGAWVALAGLLLGLCFLTKAEVFLAAACASATLLAAAAWRETEARARLPRTLAILAAAALLAPLVAWALLSRQLSAGEALRGTLGSWPWVLGGDAGGLLFYRQGMGLDAPGERAGELLAWTGRWLLVLGPITALAFSLRRSGNATTLAASAAAVLAGSLCLGLLSRHDWLAAPRPLPLFVAALGALFAWRVVKRTEGHRAARGRLALCVFALLLLAKMILNARILHYGFALALPATMLVVVALVSWLPAWLDSRGRAGWVLRAAAIALFAAAATAHLRITSSFLAAKSQQVGSGPDRFRADARGALVNAALEELRAQAPPGATLAVLPEGVMLNWLSRRMNPTPYVNFMPPELALFGEREILAAFEDRPPDFVLLVHKDTSEYGFPLFGPDYGTALASWIQERYQSVRQLGQPPLVPGTVFGILFLRRR